MELQWTDLPLEVQSKLETRLFVALEICTQADFISILKSCELLGYKPLNQKGLTDAFVSSLMRFGPEQFFFSPKMLVSSVHNAGKLGVNWTDIPSDVRFTILSGIEKNCCLFELKSFLVTLTG
jgi:hypothetical protein